MTKAAAQALLADAPHSPGGGAVLSQYCAFAKAVRGGTAGLQGAGWETQAEVTRIQMKVLAKRSHWAGKQGGALGRCPEISMSHGRIAKCSASLVSLVSFVIPWLCMLLHAVGSPSACTIALK